MTPGTPFPNGLQQGGTCPACKRPILVITSGKCSYCGASVADRVSDGEAVKQKIQAMAPGWDLDRLKAWMQNRPALLARAWEAEAWPCLSNWVAEPLWRSWESQETHRRANGQARRIGNVTLEQVGLLGFADDEKSLSLRVLGRRSAFVVDLKTGLVVSGNRGAKPFAEAWKLEGTGQRDNHQDSNCRNCGAPVPPEQFRCESCGTWQIKPAGPWRLLGIQDLMQAAVEALPIIQHEPSLLDSLNLDRDEPRGLFGSILDDFIC